ncbi:MAG: rod shape-determining protein MreC [Bilophila wadsworthia]
MYLGMYSWNQRTHILDNFAANTGLEASGVVLKSVRMVQDTVMGAWNRYLDLVDVREENDELKKQVEQLRHKLLMASEERAELVRLRRLLTLRRRKAGRRSGPACSPGAWGEFRAGVRAHRARVHDGAIPGTPVMTPQGVAGRVLRAGPSSATVLLLVDPGSRIAVISQESRIQGVLVGGGPDKPLEMRFVSHNDVIRAGEILVTSGLDDAFPKGIPVARVLSATPSDLSPFQSIQAAPLATLSDLEELLLISRVEGSSVSGSLSGVLEAPRSPSSDSAGSPAAQRAQPQPGQQGSTIPGPPRPDAPFFLSGPTPPPGLPLRSRP